MERPRHLRFAAIVLTAAFSASCNSYEPPDVSERPAIPGRAQSCHRVARPDPQLGEKLSRFSKRVDNALGEANARIDSCNANDDAEKREFGQ